MRCLALLLLPLLFIGGRSAARLHADTDSCARLRLERASLELSLELDLLRVMEVCEAPPPTGGDWTAADLEAVLPRARDYLHAHWQLELDGAPVVWTAAGFETVRAVDPVLGGERQVGVRLYFTTARPAGDLVAMLTQTLLRELEPNHRHQLEIDSAGSTRRIAVANGVACPLALEDDVRNAAAWRAARWVTKGLAGSWRWPWLGALFVALALAPLRRRRRLLGIAAASATTLLAFVAARRDWIAPAAWAATAAAVVAVVWVVGENVLCKPVRWRTTTASLFGLVEGMALEQRFRGAAPDALPGASVGFCAGMLLVAVASAAVALLLRGEPGAPPDEERAEEPTPAGAAPVRVERR